MNKHSNVVARYTPSERGNHWFTALMFILVALSGLAFFHPAFFFLSNLFGGGTWTRILHPFLGVILLISFLGLAARFGRDNRITDADREWGKHLGEILRNQAANLPEIGKYNLGQKYLFWLLVVSIPVAAVSGMVIWQPYFAPAFGVTVVRVAVVIHALSAFLAIAGIMVHIYAAIWTKGSVGAMTRGVVPVSWARHHHPAWYRKVVKGAK